MRPSTQARLIPIVIAVLTLLLLSQSLLVAAPAKSSRSSRNKASLQKRLQANNTRIRNVKAKITTVRAKARQTKTRLHEYQKREVVSRSATQYWLGQYQRKQIELKRANNALAKAKREFELSRGEAKERLVALYQRGEPGYLELMLSSDDYGEMLQRAQLAKYMMEQDREVLDQLKERKERLDDYQNQVEQKKREVAMLKQRWQATYSRDLSNRTSTAKTLSQQRQELDQMMNELEALERDSNSVAAMLRAMQRTRGGQSRLNGRRYAVGGLPVAGRITSPFGYRTHPILRYRRLHTGLDIGAPSGTPIHAAGNGEVIFAGWRGGYGNTVIIDHGGGRATLYAHMSRIGARVGQVVPRGTIIGNVGSTGLSTGPHLHYEVRINGNPVNPL